MTKPKRSASSMAAGTPWLEHIPGQNGPAQKTLLLSFPFTIGRNDTADLPIRSSRVSREHASILRAADTYRIRDLDSTNGTFLNGVRIEEATLTDGDILLVADLEFTFFSGAVKANRNTVTQVIGFREKSNSSQPKCLDLVRSLRHLQENLLHGGCSPAYQPIIELRTGWLMGVEAVARSASGQVPSETDRLVLAAQPRLASQLRELFCLAAAEESLRRPEKLFLPLESNEVDLAVLESLLSRLSAVLSDFSTLVIEIPDSDVNDAPYFHSWYACIRACGAALCYRDFAAGRTRLEEYGNTPPDFIKLSPSMVRGVGQDANRRAACEKLMKACRELKCKAIAAGIDDPAQAELFCSLGCSFGQGSACQTQAEAANQAATSQEAGVAEQEAVMEKVFAAAAGANWLREPVLS